jgi:hypothetical protein
MEEEELDCYDLQNKDLARETGCVQNKDLVRERVGAVV